jgi:hypothetical protein
MTEELKPLTTLSGRNISPSKPKAPPADDHERELLLNAVARLKSAAGEDGKVTEAICGALRRGRLQSWVWNGSMFFSLPVDFWTANRDDLNKRLGSGVARWASIEDQWIFVGRPGVDALQFSLSKQRSAPFVFEMTRARWPLYEACIWAATDGRDTTTGAIAEGRLEEFGAVKLFAELGQQNQFDGGAIVYGTTPRLHTRSSVSPGDWDSAHTGWREQGNEVQFRAAYDRTPGAERDYVCADLHKSHRSEPYLTDLWMNRDDVLRLFPAKAREPKSSRGPKRYDDTALHEQMKALIDDAVTNGSNLSVSKAADIIAKANPGHSVVSTQKRLAAHFGEQYPEYKRPYYRDE